MAYADYQFDILVAEDASLATAAEIGAWTPGYQPYTLRAAALVFTTAPNAAGATDVVHRTTAGDAGTDTVVLTINYDATTGAAGNVVFVDGFEQLVIPGEELAFGVSNATPTAGAANLILFVQPSWEHPDNNPNMTEST